MRRYVGMAVGTGLIAVVLSVTGGLPALAQGALKPVVSVIVNDVTQPVPVLVTNTPPPEAPALVKCSLKLGTSTSTTETGLIIGGTTVDSIQCPGGVTKVDVQRVYFSPELGNMSDVATVRHWRCTFGLSDAITMEPNDLVAVLTEGSPDSVLSRPLRVDTGASAYVVYHYLNAPGSRTSMPVPTVRSFSRAFRCRDGRRLESRVSSRVCRKSQVSSLKQIRSET